LETCDRKTRIIAISWVGFASGFRIDVGEVVKAAHERGILVLLDAIQGLGVFPMDVRGTDVDFPAADGRKWMSGPEGAEVLYVRRDHLRTLRPLVVGWYSVVHKYDYSHIELNLADTAVRDEGGSQNMAGLLGLGGSLNLLAEYGVGPEDSAVGDRVLEISDLACERLLALGATVFSDRSAAHRSGIVAFEMSGKDSAAVRRRCLKHGVALSRRGGRLRISRHAYCNQDDVERLITNFQ
jgi:selenocysteine lyase/cysteine desulfurase